MRNPDQTLDGSGFLKGGGELGAAIRAHDWSASPLGPAHRWPQSLKTAVRIMLTSRQPIWIGWGKDLTYLYNDAYKSVIGGRHPAALGRPIREVWPEIWDEIKPLLATAMQGDEGVYVENQMLIMERNGYPEETYYTFSFSPIPDDDGGVGGIICASTDDTPGIIGKRQLALLREVAAETVDATDAGDACRRAAGALAAIPQDVPFAAIYLQENEGLERAAVAGLPDGDRRLFPDRVDTGRHLVWPFASVLELDEAVSVDLAGVAGEAPLPTGPWPLPPAQALVLPLAGTDGTAPRGVLVAGLNPYRTLDESYEGFLALLAGQVGSAIAKAEAFEAERRRAAALAEIDKAKTVFFSNVSHEFRTPLTLMLGPLEDVLGQPQSIAPEQHRQLRMAQRNAQRLLRLVNSLLDFARIESGRVRACYQPTDLGALTADLVSSFRAATDRAGIALTVEHALPEPVHVDRDMWEKIVLNLLSNAFKFTLDGGIAVRLAAQDGRAVLTVRDTGTGIPASELPRLFDRFHRVEGAQGRSFEGTGIGLSLVRELVEQHSGTIDVASDEGVGTTVTVAIPLGTAHLPAERIAAAASAPGDANLRQPFVEEALRWLPDETAPGAERLASEIIADADELPRAPAPERTGARIVLADDNADLRLYLTRLLEADRHEVIAVANGEAALRAVRDQRPSLVISDVMMPRMNGFELLQALRADPDLGDLPVLLLSARAGEESRVAGLDAGADDYLTKPFSARELVARVDSLISLYRVRREAGETLRESEARFRNIADHSPLMMWVTGPDGRCTYLNRSWYEFTGQRREEAEGFGWLTAVHPDDRDWSERRFREANSRQQAFRLEYRLRHRDGSYRWAIDAAAPRFGADGTFLGYVGSVLDIDAHKRQEALQSLQNTLLELALKDQPLDQVLDELVRSLQGSLGRDTACSILLADPRGRRLRHGAAVGLPEAYSEAVDGIEIGPRAGSCGTAAYRKTPVHVADITADPLWQDFRSLAAQLDFRSCWSRPILGSHGNVLGTFAIYAVEAREPSPREEGFLELVSQTAALVLERYDVRQALDDQRRLLETLNRTGAGLAGELDLDALVQLVTDAGVDLTGAQFGAFFYNVTDARGDSYTLYSLSGVDKEAFETFPMPRKTRVFGPTFDGTGIIHSDDITRDPRYGQNAPYHGMPEGHLPVRSYLAVPVVSRSGEVIGGLFFGHEDVARFTAHHEQLMAGVAAQAAIAIDNARLYQSARHELEARRFTERALRSTQNDLEVARERMELALAAGAIIGTWVWHIPSDTFTADERFARAFGLDPERCHDGITIAEAAASIHPDDRDAVERLIEKTLQDCGSYRAEYRVRHADGTYRWVEANGRCELDDDGNPTRFPGVLIDIEQRRQIETDLQKREADLALLLDATAEGFYAVDTEGRATRCNAAFLRMMGFASEQELLGRKLHDEIHHSHPDGTHYPADACPIYRTARTGEPAHVDSEVFFRTDGSSFPVEYWVRPVVWQGELQGAVCNFADISERKRAEEARQLLLRELNHRVKNLFSITAGMVNMTARRAGSVDEMAASLHGRLLALARAHELIGSSISANRSHSAPTQLAPLIERIMTPHVGGRPDAMHLSGPPVPVGPSAATSFALIFHELATNAAKYGALSSATGSVAIAWEHTGDGLRLTWTETGGPAVQGEPVRGGFGSQLARLSASGQLGGTIDYEWSRDGVKIYLSAANDRLAH
ncbi:PAS domain S-box protein [Halovulum marinum]|uniref:PAS domain S-box protein n=1 Tax=Halovulum marinum TaxID=2662447 RepID=UPI002D76FA92|nr:PAS domain S-box protein [Halovulum marinum]